MGLKEYAQRYREHEARELARRAEKKKKLRAYIALKNKPVVGKKPTRKFSKEAFTKAMGNPYDTKFPKVKKVLKKIKKRKKKKVRTKVVYIYK